MKKYLITNLVIFIGVQLTLDGLQVILYIVYGPLANRAVSIMFEGVPNYPDYGRFWDVVDKHKVKQFYTAPTALRALMKEGNDHVTSRDLSTLRLLVQ